MNKSIFLVLALVGFVSFAGFHYQQQQRYNHIYLEHSQNLAQNYLQAARAVAQSTSNNSQNSAIFSPEQLQSLDFSAQQQPNQALALLNPDHETGDFRRDFLIGLNFLEKNELQQADLHLQLVANQDCVLRDDARFLLALSALRDQQPERAKKYLSPLTLAENSFQQRAKNILSQL